MSAETFRFDFHGERAFTQGHTGSGGVVLALGVTGRQVTTLHMSAETARAMATALEAAATFAENVLDTGLGESAVEVPV